MTKLRNKKLMSVAIVTALVLAMLLSPAPLTNASDHIDGPQLAHDHASDINDMYLFLDPNDNSKAVMMMTINPFIISSEAIGQAIFDHNLRYRFEIENTGDAIADRFIDVTFTRGVGRETEQIATITLPDSNANNSRFSASAYRLGTRGDVKVTGNRTSFTAPSTITKQGTDVDDITPPDFVVTNFGSGANQVQFFAGTTDDPFFLDNTAANRFVLSSIRNPGSPDRDVFANRAGLNAAGGSSPDADRQIAGQLAAQTRNRGLDQTPNRSLVGRDTYSGFNTLLIAISVPASMLRGTSNEIGLNGQTQRRRTQIVLTNGQVVGSGSYVTVDREGVPLVNNGLIPAPLKDRYNGASTANDNQDFAAVIDRSLQAFGTEPQFRSMILDVVARRGDILRLDLTVPNTGEQGGNNPDGGFGKGGGRRLIDDVADATFTLINNGQPLGDFVDQNDFEFGNTFPFVAPQVLPNPNGINDPDTRIRL